MKLLPLFLILMFTVSHFSQQPPIEAGVPKALAEWRASRYSDVRYKLNLTLEKMSPVLKGTIEIRVTVKGKAFRIEGLNGGSGKEVTDTPIVLDWRKIKGYENLSSISNVSINGTSLSQDLTVLTEELSLDGPTPFLEEANEHLVIRDGVKLGENVIKLDFTSPILASGSAVTRYVDKEDGSEYLYSLFVPSDASTAFPVFDQPDLKARFTLTTTAPIDWKVVSNSASPIYTPGTGPGYKKWINMDVVGPVNAKGGWVTTTPFTETKPISTYVFAFAAGPWAEFTEDKQVVSRGSGGDEVASGERVSRTSGPNATDDPGTGGVAPDAGFRTSGAPTSFDETSRRSASGSTSGYYIDAPPVLGDDPSRSNAQRGTLPTGRVSASASGKSNRGESVRSPHVSKGSTSGSDNVEPSLTVGLRTRIYVRKSQAEKFKAHAAEVFRLNREGIKYLEEYFDYKYPFPKYDIVLIPEFPFGGMEHAGATFLKESSIIFPSEPTANDYISRANVIFHEAAHQWFGDTVTMRWFDDLWLKEGFAEFMAYKTLERVMPQYNAWKAFYERNKPAAYATDSTRGTTPIYQEIPNLSAAKSAYGNIVYRKAPSFLRQAEFYLGPDKFQAAVQAFLKKHEFGNAGWEDLVHEFNNATWDGSTASAIAASLSPDWTDNWIRKRGMPVFKINRHADNTSTFEISQSNAFGEDAFWREKVKVLTIDKSGKKDVTEVLLDNKFSNIVKAKSLSSARVQNQAVAELIFPNYQDYGYGIFLLDDKSREYVLKNIQNEKDDFLRSMMWGTLWDSVREGELDPREYVELVIRNFSTTPSAQSGGHPSYPGGEQDELTIQTILGRVSTAMTYYIPNGGSDVSVPPAVAGGAVSSSASNRANDLNARLENLLIEKMRTAPAMGQRVTYYRAFLNVASTENARKVLKEMLSKSAANAPKAPPATAGGTDMAASTPRASGGSPTLNGGGFDIPLKTKDRFDIVTKLAILGDPDAPALLAELEKAETSDDAKRYAYSAHAAFPMKENREKFWNDFVNNKDISESWIEAAMGPFNSPRHSELSLPYLQRALAELPNLKRNRKIFFVNGWLGAFIGGQKSQEALDIVNKFLADNPNLDRDLRLKVLENVDVVERAVKIRKRFESRL